MLIVVLVLGLVASLQLRAAYRERARRIDAARVQQAVTEARDHVDAVLAAGVRQMHRLAQGRTPSWKEW